MKLFKRENILSKIRGFYQSNGLIKVITGIRRCGKSSIMKIISEEIVEKYGVNPSNIIFIDFNKRPYKRITQSIQLESLIDEKTKNLVGTKYLFLDEIQNIEGFETIVEAFRLEDEYNFFITGSNSYLLSGELVTKLTGRYIEFEMGTLTFDEYLNMKSFYKLPTKTTKEEFEEYIYNGGFPETIHLPDKTSKNEYSTNVIKEIFIKDIKKNHKIKNVFLFDQVQKYIINNFGSTTSVKTLAEHLSKINNMKVSVQSVYNYIDLLQNAKIIQKCSRFDLKSKSSINGEEKYYLADLSFYFANQTDNRINYGQCLENIIYNYAVGKGYSASIGKIGKLECDFILRKKSTNDYSYVQVCYSMIGSLETEEREYKPLEVIKDNYVKYVITTDTLIQKRNGILHVNAYEFMANGKEF